jgi:hypothetical protein
MTWTCTWMLLASAAGMLGGLWLDAGAGGLDRLASLCAGAPPDLPRLLQWHWSELPLAHVGMVAAGLAGIAALPRTPRGRLLLAGLLSLLCSASMLLGMGLGVLLLLEVAAWLGSPATAAGTLAGMAAGMVAGAAALAAATRACATVRKRGPKAAKAVLHAT